MASISSTNGTSSLGNTSLRGFGGMVSGIDRDSIVEQMTLGTTTKINNQKKKVTQLQWKQEAYMGISDKIIDLTDKYASYSSGTNLKDPYAFAKNQITVHGKDDATKFVQASGSSALVDNVSIKNVKQLATSTVLQSGTHTSNGIQMEFALDKVSYISNLAGTQLKFGTWNADPKGGGKFDATTTFTFKESYKDDKGVEHKIDYTMQSDEYKNLTTEKKYEKLVEDLNELLEDDVTLTTGGVGVKISDIYEFGYEKVTGADAASDDYRIVIKQKDTVTDTKNITLQTNSSALGALGYKIKDGVGIASITIGKDGLDGPNVEDLKKSFTSTGIRKQTTEEYLKDNKKLTFNLDGTKKTIELMADDEKTLEDMKNGLQDRLNQAFGEGKIKVEVESNNKGLIFTTSDTNKSSTLSVLSSDTELLNNLKLEYGSSTKVNLDGTLKQPSLLGPGDDLSNYVQDGELNLVINGEKISGLTEKSSISDILSKINSTTAAGVKATYVDATGTFMLVSTETGSGRKIDLGGDDTLASKLFGGTGSKSIEGKDALITVSYGNGVDVELQRSSNTFNLEGMNVTVSGVFGGSYETVETKDGAGNVTKTEQVWKDDPSQTVTFSAKADVDGVVEKVKTFFEDFNALVTEINTQITTRPDSAYGPLTDEQKEQMDDTSIENWEKKAKQGMLYGDAAMRDLSMDVQSIFTQMMNNGASYEDLNEIGITYSEDYSDGGTLVFDEAKFRTAMESNPEKVSNIFTGGGKVKKGLINAVEDTFTPYATRYAKRNGNSYGRLVEIAGTNKKPTTLMNNQIYKELKEMQETIESLQARLKTEQDRYISQFTTMESLINKMNTQSSYLSQITG